ncbi:GH92 family glycosyl hydrolase [Dysgonomonas capnocytophagoides]|uniref:GH92 family glycosyl hydrolase n=1 Tax=Dysgonomonas capnocytophagoides TaxID=45254 RepID=UPI00292084CD|nr:GH92 family glycosyl hydrolase [Dysgonomonas capnocytophagoides]
MNKLRKQLFAVFCLISIPWVSAAEKVEPVDYVNPLTGTLSKFELSTGNNYPVIARPWGMNFWSPQTGKMGDGWLYTYTADKIRGFKQTHQPSPWMNDYGQFSIMPITGKITFDEEKRASWFSHKAEVAKPYYYKVYLADHDITTEITPTSRAAMFRITFPESTNSYIIVDAFDKGSYVKIIPDENKIIGYTTRNSGGVPENFKNYFVIKFDKAFTYKAVVDDNEILRGETEVSTNHAGAVIGFQTRRGEKIHAKVASSFISYEQAEQNLKELGSDTFDELTDKGRDEWNQVLSKIEVEDDNLDHLRTFYSCLYRSVQFPRTFYEINAQGEVVHYSPFTGEVLPGYMFTDTGFWDTFRCLFPFLNLVYPSINEKIQAGLVNAYNESGFLPEWGSPGHRNIMIGQNSASVVADAFVKGLKGYDIEQLWKAVTRGANDHLKETASGRVGYEYYNKLGYVPNNVSVGQNVARTLEYAYNDWSIYQLGKVLGKSANELEQYKKGALNYKNVYNPKHKMMCGKDDKGVFNPQFKPEDWSNEFCEGNSWHWSFCVFHDPQGLIDLMGGKDTFNQMMDSVFIIPSYLGINSRNIIHEMREMQVMDMGQYAHGNQPIQHMPYLYNYSGEPWKTQFWVREIMEKLYNPNPDAYCGDEDNGQTSAWYVFSAMGFYPVSPATDEYVLGAPLFKSVKVNLENGKSILIKSMNNSKDNRYVKSVRLGKKVYSKNYFTHKDLTGGAEIIFEMSSVPNKNRGTNDVDYPYSFSKELEGSK